MTTYGKSFWNKGMAVNPSNLFPPPSTSSLINAPLDTDKATVKCYKSQPKMLHTTITYYLPLGKVVREVAVAPQILNKINLANY